MSSIRPVDVYNAYPNRAQLTVQITEETTWDAVPALLAGCDQLTFVFLMLGIRAYADCEDPEVIKAIGVVTRAMSGTELALHRLVQSRSPAPAVPARADAQWRSIGASGSPNSMFNYEEFIRHFEHFARAPSSTVSTWP